MRHVNQLSLGLLALAGWLTCASIGHAQRPEEVLVGRWVLDHNRTAEASDEQTAQILAFFGSLTIDLRKDGTSQVIAISDDERKTQTGTWQVIEADGKSMDLEMFIGESKKKESFKATLLQAGDYLQLATTKDQPFKFVFILARDNEQRGFVPLFDGKSLAGWEGNEKMFRVEKGAIVAGTLKARIAHNEFLCTTDEYDDFELRLTARLVGQGQNAGVQFRSRRIPNHHEVIGYQCDIGASGERPIWGALYDESRRRKVLASGDDAKIKNVLKPDDWNELVIRCRGPRIQIWVNGYQTVDYTEPDDKIARRGIIGLQIHGGAPAEASYKDIRIKSLQ